MGGEWIVVDRFRLLDEMFSLFQFPCPLLSQLLPKHDPTCLRRGRQNLQVTFQELQTPINDWQLSRNDCEMRKINCGDNVEAVDWSVCRFNSAKSTCQVNSLRLTAIQWKWSIFFFQFNIFLDHNGAMGSKIEKCVMQVCNCANWLEENSFKRCQKLDL